MHKSQKRKNIKGALLYALLILLCVFAFTGYAAAEEKSQAEVVVSALNIRAGAGVEHEVLIRLGQGTQLTVLENTGEWAKVQTGEGLVGWAAAEYLSLAAPLQTTIDGIRILVNEKKVDFDVPPFINTDGRTMVPIRFVGEELGAQVDWLAAEQKVVILDQGKKVEIQIGKKEASVAGKTVAMDTQASLVDGRTMVPLRFISESFGAEVIWKAEEKTVVIKKSNPPPTTGVTPPTIVATPSEKQMGMVTGSVVNLRKGPGTEFAILEKLSRGEVLDVMYSSEGWLFVRTLKGVEGWITDQYVALQTPREDRAPTAARGTGEVVSVSSSEPSLQFPALIGLSYEVQKEAFFLTIQGNTGLNYTAMTLENPARVVFDFQGVQCDTSLQYLEKEIGDHELIRKVRVAQFSDTVSRVVVELAKPAGYEVLNRTGEQEMTFLFSKGGLSGKTIIIDPGHGTVNASGVSDPGAIGPTGVREREVVMDIANQVADLLAQKGANIVLTRTGPQTLSTLDDRVSLANSLQADIYVSIHANANFNKEIQGTSTYFYAPASDPMLSSQRAARIRLAQLVQQAVVAHGGRRNMGIMENSFKVLRETTMPSILVETAFISNPTEEQLLTSSDFRRKMALGIVEGIEQYFSW